MYADPLLWISAAKYAAIYGLNPAEIEAEILEGVLDGAQAGSDLYVSRPRVILCFPDPGNVDIAELHLLALPLGRYLTAARNEFVIPLVREDPDRGTSLDALLAAIQDEPKEPVPIRLAGREWWIDASLILDLAWTLNEFEWIHDRHRVSAQHQHGSASQTNRSMPPVAHDQPVAGNVEPPLP